VGEIRKESLVDLINNDKRKQPGGIIHVKFVAGVVTEENVNAYKSQFTGLLSGAKRDWEALSQAEMVAVARGDGDELRRQRDRELETLQSRYEAATTAVPAGDGLAGAQHRLNKIKEIQERFDVERAEKDTYWVTVMKLHEEEHDDFQAVRPPRGSVGGLSREQQRRAARASTAAAASGSRTVQCRWCKVHWFLHQLDEHEAKCDQARAALAAGAAAEVAANAPAAAALGAAAAEVAANAPAAPVAGAAAEVVANAPAAAAAEAAANAPAAPVAGAAAEVVANAPASSGTRPGSVSPAGSFPARKRCRGWPGDTREFQCRTRVREDEEPEEPATAPMSPVAPAATAAVAHDEDAWMAEGASIFGD
jgi:hypothetical protein